MALCTDPQDNPFDFHVLTIGTVSGAEQYTIDTAIIDLGVDSCKIFGETEPGYPVLLRAGNSSGSMGGWTSAQPVFGRYVQMEVTVNNTSQVDSDSGMTWWTSAILDTCIFRYYVPTGSPEEEPVSDVSGSEYPFWERIRPLWWPRWSKVYQKGSTWQKVDFALQKTIYNNPAFHWYGMQELPSTQAPVWCATVPNETPSGLIYAAGQRVEACRSLYELYRSYEPCVFASGNTWYFRNLDRNYVLFHGASTGDVIPGAAGDLVEDEPIYVQIEGRWYTIPESLIDRTHGVIVPPTARDRIYSYSTHSRRGVVSSLGRVNIGNASYPLRLTTLGGAIWEHARFSDVLVRQDESASSAERRVMAKWFADRLDWRIAASLMPVSITSFDGSSPVSVTGGVMCTVPETEYVLTVATLQPDGTYLCTFYPMLASIVQEGRLVECEVFGNQLKPTEPVMGGVVLVWALVQNYTVSAGTLTPSANLTKGDYYLFTTTVPSVENAETKQTSRWDCDFSLMSTSEMDVL